MNNISYIELVLSDYTTYMVKKDNIVSCDYLISPEKVDCTECGGGINDDVLLFKRFELVIEDYHNMIGYDNEDIFDVNRLDISEIAIYTEDGAETVAYVDMTHENNNDNQINMIMGDTLTISIEEK